MFTVSLFYFNLFQFWWCKSIGVPRVGQESDLFILYHYHTPFLRGTFNQASNAKEIPKLTTVSDVNAKYKQHCVRLMASKEDRLGKCKHGSPVASDTRLTNSLSKRKLVSASKPGNQPLISTQHSSSQILDKNLNKNGMCFTPKKEQQYITFILSKFSW